MKFDFQGQIDGIRLASSELGHGIALRRGDEVTFIFRKLYQMDWDPCHDHVHIVDGFDWDTDEILQIQTRDYQSVGEPVKIWSEFEETCQEVQFPAWHDAQLRAAERRGGPISIGYDTQLAQHDFSRLKGSMAHSIEVGKNHTLLHLNNLTLIIGTTGRFDTCTFLELGSEEEGLLCRYVSEEN